MNLIKKAIYGLLVIIIALLVFSGIVKATEVEITGDIINLRQEASTDSTIIIQIAKGEKCELLEEEGNWYRIKYGDYTGYVSKDYAEIVADSSSEESNNTESNNTTQEENSNTEESNTTQEESTTTEQENNTNSGEEQNTTSEGSSASNSSRTGKTNKNTSVRIVPLINSSRIATLRNNTDVTVIEELNGWAYIQTDEIAGWVRAINLDIDNSNSTKQPSNEKNEQDTNSNNSGNTDSTNNDSSDGNTDNNSNDDNNSDTTDNSTDFSKRTMYTNDATNIRSKPSTSSDIIMLVSINTALEVIGEEGDWYKVNTSEGEAYVSKDLLSNSRVNITNRGGIDRTSDSTEKKESTTSKTTTENTGTSLSAKASEIVSYAKKFLGVPYVYGGASPSGFDCSGFTMYVYNHFGISMRHGAQAQAKLGEKVTANKSSKSSLLNNLEVGDLVFFLDYETMDEIGHCGIYIGDGNFIHASSGSGYCVKINSLLPGEYYNTRYCAARRII